MPSDIAISVKNLTKKYRIFGHPGDRIKQALTFGRVRFHREFTALQDVSFEIKKGETVGIIGRNGSGKSTLLQLICGILKPTSAKCKLMDVSRHCWNWEQASTLNLPDAKTSISRAR